MAGGLWSPVAVAGHRCRSPVTGSKSGACVSKFRVNRVRCRCPQRGTVTQQIVAKIFNALLVTVTREFGGFSYGFGRRTCKIVVFVGVVNISCNDIRRIKCLIPAVYL